MLEQKIKAEAKKLGFELVGITTPEPPPHFGVFEAWLNAGQHGQMEYLATQNSRQRRADPRQILPECKSILVLGFRYAFQESIRTPELTHRNLDRTHEPGDHSHFNEYIDPNNPRTPRGRVAAYAWGTDYHDLFPTRLQAIVDFIERQIGRPVLNRWYTDTGPILERDLAQRAGLGWIGKNTCLINPEHGSYFLLAEILLDLELVPDQPFTPDHCGSCRRCLDACPTQCILPDRTIDASRCISYLTIELKGSIPAPLRPDIGDWVFGCDICQEACPWNERFAVRSCKSDINLDPGFVPRPEVPRPLLESELSLSPQEFNRKFNRSPVKRAKRRGYLRNVAVALGNRKEYTSIPVLAQALLNDPEPLVRGHSSWALGKIGGSQAREILAKAAKDEQDKSVLAEIRAALSNLQVG